MEKQHPELLQAGTLALVFEERVMPRAGAGEGEGGGDEHQGPEHVVSFDALMTWPDVKVRTPVPSNSLGSARSWRSCGSVFLFPWTTDIHESHFPRLKEFAECLPPEREIYSFFLPPFVLLECWDGMR